jgi:tagatose-1,6-bisphosphate aldolase
MTAGSDRVEQLDKLATDSGQFAILALDHLRSFAATVRPNDPDSLTPAEMRELKQRLIDGLADKASAILIDPALATSRMIEASSPLSVGLIIGIEDGDYEAAEVSPRLLPGWTVERAAQLGADAVKISFFFDLDADTAPAERFVKDTVRQCELADLPLFCEPLARWRGVGATRRAVLGGIERFGSLGADVLKIQFPYDTQANGSRDAWLDACEEANELSPVPWALLSEGRDYDEFRELLAIACRAGASGFLGGRAIWGGAVTARDAMATYAQRLGDLRSIAISEGAPWRRNVGRVNSTQLRK